MIRKNWPGASAALFAAAMTGSLAVAQESPTPGAPLTPPPVEAAPDSGPPPADTPAAQSPDEMPVDEGTANDLPAGAPSAAPPVPAGEAAAPAEADDPAAAEASPSPEAPNEVASLDAYIEDVQVVGPWSEGASAGVWRTVMVREAEDPDAYRFFIQSVTDEGGSLVVRETTEITELAEIEGGIVGYRADEGSGEEGSGVTLFFDIVPSDGEIAETYELHFFGAAQPYMFGPATN